MGTFANACAALPSDGRVQGNRPTGQAAGEPQTLFDDVVTLTRIRAEVSPDKKAVEDAATTYAAPAGPVGWESQVLPIPRRNPSLSAPQIVSQEDTLSSQGRLAGVKSRVGAAFPDQVATPAGAKGTKVAGAKAGGQTPKEVYQHGSGDGGSDLIARVGRWDVGRKEGAGAARQVAQNGRCGHTGDKVAPKDDGFKVSSATKPGPKVHPAVTREQARAGPRCDNGSGGQEAKMRVAQSGAKESRSARFKERGTVQPEPPASSIEQSVAGALHPPVEPQTHGAVAVKSDVTDNPLRNLREQILDSVQGSTAQGQRQVTIRLQPPELGTVLVRFREEDEHLDGVLEVAKAETRRQIEQALPEVVRSLQDAGIAIRRLDVTSGEPSGQELGRGLSQQDAGAGQYGSGHNRDHLPASQGVWPQPSGGQSANSRDTPSADHHGMAGHGGIDVLL